MGGVGGCEKLSLWDTLKEMPRGCHIYRVDGPVWVVCAETLKHLRKAEDIAEEESCVWRENGIQWDWSWGVARGYGDM